MDIKRPGPNRPERLKWHPAFFQAIQLELADYKNSLQFEYEYQLTTEPLRVDLLIIKKPRDLAINKNIARIFKSDNIVEFKSPEDYLSVRDFLKVYAYAYLYAAITPEAGLSAVTLSFVEHRHPRELIGYLTGERKYEVEETGPGIYTVRGDYLPIQIIETKRLSEGENLWLKSLTNDLESGAAGVILKAGKEVAREAPMNAYLDVLLRANPRAFLEAWSMANDTATFEEVFMEAGIIPQWIERGIEQGIERGIEQGLERGIERGKEEKALAIARNLLAKGWTVENVAETTDMPLEKVRSLVGD